MSTSHVALIVAIGFTLIFMLAGTALDATGWQQRTQGVHIGADVPETGTNMWD